MYLRISGAGRPNNIELPVRSNEINVLIALHILFFILYNLAGYMGWLEAPMAGRTTADFIRSGIAISLDPNDMKYFHWGSLFGYQFVHSNPIELVLNMSFLWVFGHTLKTKIGERSVILLYFVGTILSALVFLASHYIFTVYTGVPVMEGAFGGVLMLMAATGIYFRSATLHIGDRSFSVLRACLVLVGLSFVIFYQPTISFILVFVASVFAGGRYAAWQTNLLRGDDLVPDGDLS